MDLLSLLQPRSLIIWIPGLILLVSTFYTYARAREGTVTPAVQYTNLGLYVLTLVLIFYVPNNEINKTLAFANAIDESGETVTAYEDIPFQAKDAFRMTAMTEEERLDFMSYSGAEDRGPVIVDGNELVFRPQAALAWSFLFVLFVMSTLVFAQDIRTFLRKNSGA